MASAEPLMPWKSLVRARAETESEEAMRLMSPPNAHVAQAMQRIVAAKKRSAAGHFWRGVVTWFTGTDQELCWSDLHEADVQLVHARPVAEVIADVADLKNRVRMEFPKRNDVYGQDLLDELDHAKSQLERNDTAVQETGRETVAHIKQALYERSHASYQGKRAFRNILVWLIGAVLTFAVALAVPGVGLSGWIADTIEPAVWTGTEAFTTVWRVELVGMLGGLIAGAAAVQKLQGMSGSYSLPFLLAVLKLPMGAITGVVGAIVVQSGDFWIDPVDKRPSFYALVLLFGASQQLITRLVDARASEIADTANPAKESPVTG